MNDSHPPHHPWLRAGFFSLMEKVAGMAFNLGTAMLLLRLLTKEGFATWGIFILLTYFVEMGRNGLLQNGLVRALATRKNNTAAQGDIITAAFALNLSFALVSNAVLWVCADWLRVRYQVPALSAMLPFYYVTNVVMVFFTMGYYVQQAHGEFRGVFWSAVFYRGAVFLWVLWCWWTGWPVLLENLSVALLAGAALATLATWWYAWPYFFFSKRIDFHWIKNLAGYGKYVLGTNLSTMFYKNIDKLTLGQLLGPVAFALYDAAGRVTQLVEAPAFSIAAVVFPKTAERMEQEGTAGVKNLYERSVGATLAIILPFVVFVLLFANPVIRIFAGGQYMESANVLRLTAFFGLFLPFAVQFGTALDSTGKPATNFAYTFFTALLNLGLSYLLIPQFGLFGAAFATLAGYAISFVLMQIYLRKHFDIRPLRAFVYVPVFYKMMWNLLAQRLNRRPRKA